MRRSLSLSACLALTVLAVGACFGAGPVTESAGYRLTMLTDKAEYAAEEPIEAFAEFEYVGNRSSIATGSLVGGPISFSLRQLDGTIETSAGLQLSCGPLEMRRGQPMRKQFYVPFDGDPVLRLPPGKWELTAHAAVGPTSRGCSGEVVLQASQVVTVS